MAKPKTPSQMITLAKSEAKESPFKTVSAIHGLVSVIFIPRSKRQKSAYLTIHRVGKQLAVHSTLDDSVEIMDKDELTQNIREIRAAQKREDKA